MLGTIFSYFQTLQAVFGNHFFQTDAALSFEVGFVLALKMNIQTHSAFHVEQRNPSDVRYPFVVGLISLFYMDSAQLQFVDRISTFFEKSVFLTAYHIPSGFSSWTRSLYRLCLCACNIFLCCSSVSLLLLISSSWHCWLTNGRELKTKELTSKVAVVTIGVDISVSNEHMKITSWVKKLLHHQMRANKMWWLFLPFAFLSFSRNLYSLILCALDFFICSSSGGLLLLTSPSWCSVLSSVCELEAKEEPGEKAVISKDVCSSISVKICKWIILVRIFTPH